MEYGDIPLQLVSKRAAKALRHAGVTTFCATPGCRNVHLTHDASWAFIDSVILLADAPAQVPLINH
jgi:hypothetical protein